MASVVKTRKTELDDSRVRVEVEVEPAAVDRALNSAAADLGRDMRVPGFRKGKVPPQVVLQRVGRDAVLDEAVRKSLPDWYEEAIGEAGVVTVGEPSLDMPDLPEKGVPLEFTIEVGVRPPAKLGDYKGLEVGRREPEVSSEEVDEEVERLRESAASLENVERPAQTGDFVVLDFLGRVDGEPFQGGEARGYLLELGSNRLVEGFEEQLEGATAGEERQVTVTFPEDYRAEALAGNEAVFDVTVKEVKEKVLPPVDDHLASDGAGFDSLDELKDDIRSKLADREQDAIAQEFREAVVDAAVQQAEIEVPESLVHARAHELWDQTMRTLERQGISKEMYLQMAGRPEEEIVHEAMPDAERALRREAVLAAVVEAEQIEPTEDEVLEELEHVAEHEGVKPKKLLERLKSAGRLDAFRGELATRRAAELLAEEATPISVEEAQAKDVLWTPGKDEESEGAKPAAGKLWTPGQ